MVIRSRLDYTIGISFDLENKAMSCRVIKFLLQPVVENSIRYGFWNAYEENQIQISAKMQADTAFCVYDNGEGIPESLLETLNCVLDAGGEYVGISLREGDRDRPFQYCQVAPIHVWKAGLTSDQECPGEGNQCFCYDFISGYYRK